MAVDVLDYVAALKREVQPPGSTLYAGISDADWVGYLTDSFWEARLDGFLEDWEVVEPSNSILDAEFRPVATGGEDIPREMVSLVILYAGIKVLRNQILNTNTGFRAKAGPVEYEQENSATVLAEMLKQLRAAKDRIIDALDVSEETAVMYIDAFSTRLYSPLSYFGGLELSG